MRQSNLGQSLPSLNTRSGARAEARPMHRFGVLPKGALVKSTLSRQASRRMSATTSESIAPFGRGRRREATATSLRRHHVPLTHSHFWTPLDPLGCSDREPPSHTFPVTADHRNGRDPRSCRSFSCTFNLVAEQNWKGATIEFSAHRDPLTNPHSCTTCCTPGECKPCTPLSTLPSGSRAAPGRDLLQLRPKLAHGNLDVVGRLRSQPVTG